MVNAVVRAIHTDSSEVEIATASNISSSCTSTDADGE
jgi:hypothetical protein